MGVTMRDLLGRVLRDYHDDELKAAPVHRRDDDHTSRAPAEWYFLPGEEWPDFERAGVGKVRGDVLDVGCGAGRTSLWLQERGHHVLAVDRSPGALAVASDRGVARVAVADVDLLPVTADEYDTVVFAGLQFAVGTDRRDLAERLRRLWTVVPPGGRIVADLSDPTRVVDPEHAEYQADHTVEEGLTHRRFRLEYDGETGPWMDLLSVSPDVLEDLAAETGWLVGSLEHDGGARYWAVLERTRRQLAE
jgi:SAM-dependent methyltransferase